MRNNCIFFTKLLVVIAGVFSLVTGCFSPSSKKSQPESGAIDTFASGSYGYDLAFLQSNQIEVIELSDAGSGARVLLAPGYQGRVMTSSAAGNEGISFGWINYKLIASGEVNPQFNPVGGEERFWLGPEGGPFSLYFAPGKEQVYANWKVPGVIDTARFDVKEQSPGSVSFVKQAVLKNASGSEFSMEIDRQVTILPVDSLISLFSIPIPDSLNVVAYQTTNTITNSGTNIWTKNSGLPSVWMLCMFNPTPSTTVFIPYRAEASGDVVRDDYFGKVPADRLKVDDGMIWFRIDGKLRSKIGVPPGRATSLCGSYDADQQVLTLLWCSLPETPAEYVNSKWGSQADPFSGDVVNSYNDGPLDDGSIMGPFYEIETSSPAAALSPGESITHIQRIVHLQGDTANLSPVVKMLFGFELKEITAKFN